MEDLGQLIIITDFIILKISKKQKNKNELKHLTIHTIKI